MIELALLAVVLAVTWAAWRHGMAGAVDTAGDPNAEAQSLSAAGRDTEASALLERALAAQPGRGDLADALKLLRHAQDDGGGRA